MKIIPVQYQEMEVLYQRIVTKGVRCISTMSCAGGEGTSSIAVSLAQRLTTNNHSVLLIDLNRNNPFQASTEMRLPERQDDWCFSDISCQLNVQNLKQFDFLSVKYLKNDALSREKNVFEDAILRLKQEFDYIIFDMSPVTKKNQANFPLHLLSSTSDLTLLNVALGLNTEVELHETIQSLNQAGIQQVEFLVSQQHLPPLGPRLLESIDKRLKFAPRLGNFFKKWITNQSWLFYVH